jgi:hypothetical protein
MRILSSLSLFFSGLLLMLLLMLTMIHLCGPAVIVAAAAFMMRLMEFIEDTRQCILDFFSEVN